MRDADGGLCNPAIRNRAGERVTSIARLGTEFCDAHGLQAPRVEVESFQDAECCNAERRPSRVMFCVLSHGFNKP